MVYILASDNWKKELVWDVPAVIVEHLNFPNKWLTFSECIIYFYVPDT